MIVEVCGIIVKGNILHRENMMRIVLSLSFAIALAIAPTASISQIGLPFDTAMSVAANPKDLVVFNTKSHKYHDPKCLWAKRCTVNCIPITRAEAQQRGGIPCAYCNGGE